MMKKKVRQPFKVIFFIFLPIIFITSRAGENRYSSYTEQNLLDFYKYDKGQPLEVTMDTTAGGTPKLYEIRLTFKSIHRELVTAVMYVPKIATSMAPVPCLFWLHGYTGNKEIPQEFLTILEEMSYALISLDAQYHGERKRSTKDMYSLDLVQNRYGLAQTIIDHRRALDLLGTIPEIDSKRIGLIGGSMGAILGALLAGVDDRIKVLILISGGGGWAEMIRNSDLPPAVPIREYLKRQYGVVRRLLDPVDPINLIHRVQALQMHHGEEDITVPYATAVALYEKAGEPKEFWSYPGEDHYTIDEGSSLLLIMTRVITWLDQHL